MLDGVQIVDPSDRMKHRHRWLQWLGLQEPPPVPESWVAVVRGLEVDAGELSDVGSLLVHSLSGSGIDARQRAYDFYDAEPGGRVPLTQMVSCVAVLVHDRDSARAAKIARALKVKLEEEPYASEGLSGLSDEEMRRLALKLVGMLR
jgi:hypothetical protein